jgi:hypothetical protein
LKLSSNCFVFSGPAQAPPLEVVDRVAYGGRQHYEAGQFQVEIVATPEEAVGKRANFFS